MKGTHMYRFGTLGLALVLAGSAAAAPPRYGRAGCGLGSIIMGPTGNQTSAYTSNQALSTQPFAISSGTSNCMADKATEAELEQERFIFANFATMSKEMARGQGDSLRAFASLLGCSPASLELFTRELQLSYREIFSAPGALAVLDASKARLRAHPLLRRECRDLG